MAPEGIGPRGPARHRGTLPAAPNALVGRDVELAVLARLLAAPGTRLLTLTGPPGVGKTRLAVAAAAAAAGGFTDGVVFVDLTAVRDPALVTGELAAALGLPDAGDPARLAAALATKDLLVVLDNFEHVLDAGPALTGPLGACRRLRMLVTSRERLHLHAEREVPVHPLALPDDDAVTDPDRFAATPSVAMLLQGISAFQPDFTVTAVNRAALAEICVRLDGLPLALELAAARLKLFTPGELTFRLRHRMAVLTGGAHDLPDRHRTLRGALAWSHNLLSADEQALFRRLSVFVGGWTLDAARCVCAVDDVDGTTASLVDKSLVRRRTRPGEVVECGMLESLREYAAERLAEHGEAEETRSRHARHFAELAARVEAMIGTAEETAWLDRVGLDEGNLRAALTHALAAGRTDLALPLGAGLGWCAYTRGRLGEGRATLDRVLGAVEERRAAPSADALAGALLVAGVLAVALGELDRAEDLLDGALRANERVGSARRTAIGNAFLGHLARARDDHEGAVARYQRARALHEGLGSAAGVAWSRYDLGLLARRRGRPDEAGEQLRDSLGRFRAADYPWAIGCAGWALATVELRRDRAGQAAELLGEALDAFEAAGDGRGVAQCLEAGAVLVAGRGEYETAARLLGGAAALRERLAAPLPDEDRGEHRAVTRRVLGALGAGAADHAHRAGREAPQSAVAAARRAVSAVAAGADRSDPLTRREREVALLIARGCTNRQIGRALGIAEKTAEVHVHNIIRKLHARSRAQVAAWMVTHVR